MSKRCLDGEERAMRHLGDVGSGLAPEQIRLELSRLTLERQRLRELAGTSDVLESNRLEIVGRQYDLSRALITRHLKQPGERAA